MSLIKCSECGKEISDKATNCVHCGCPITSSPANSNSGGTKLSHGAISSEEAIALLKKYKPNFLRTPACNIENDVGAAQYPLGAQE